MRGLLIPRVLGVFRLRSVRLSKHRAYCNAALWSSGHRAASQLHEQEQRGGPPQSQTRPWTRPKLPASHLASRSHHGTLQAVGEVLEPGEKDRESKKERKAGTTCSSRLVRTASRRQPKGMGNVRAALSGLHDLYMMCYVKMLPVYCVYHAFFFIFFNPPPPSFPLSFSLCHRFQELKVCSSFH